MKKIFTILVFVISFLSAVCKPVSANQTDRSPLPVLVVPTIYENTAATLSFLGPLSSSERTVQFLINENQLTSLIGQYIDAITFRLRPTVASPWPASDVTYPNFDIYLSESVAPANRSLVFAQNIVGVQKQVRAGSLMIVAGSYPVGGNPNNFGTNITFDSSYLYTGGHLLIEIRHDASGGSSTSVEAAGTSTTGYGTDFSSCWQSSYTATSGMQANFCILSLTSTISGISVTLNEPVEYKLNQNYPNPFNPSTNIKFGIPRSSEVRLVIYDAIGRQVTTLISQHMNAGQYEVNWNADGYTSGMYYYTLTADGFTETKKMMLVK